MRQQLGTLDAAEQAEQATSRKTKLEIANQRLQKMMMKMPAASSPNRSAPSTPRRSTASSSKPKEKVTALSTRSHREFPTFNFDNEVEVEIVADNRESCEGVSRDVEEREEASYAVVANASTLSSMTLERAEKKAKEAEVESSGSSQQSKGSNPLSMVSNHLAEFSAKYTAIEQELEEVRAKSRKENNDLMARLIKGAEEVTAALQDNKDLMDQIKELETNVEDLKKTTHKQDEAINDKSKMIASISEMMETKTMAHEASQEAVSKLNKEVEKLQSLDNIKTQMVNKFAEDCKKKTKSMQSLQQTNDDLKGELERTKNAKDKREDDMRFCLIQLEEAQNENQKHEGGMEEARKEIKSLIEQANDLTEKNKILESKCHEESLDKETRRSSMTIVSTQLSAANARCAVLEMEHEELKDSLEAEIAKQAQELLESQDQYKALKAQNQELAQELKNDLASERARSKALDSEVECLKEQREVFQADAHLREAQIKAIEYELESTKGEVQKLHADIANAENTNKSLSESSAETKERYALLKTEFQKSKSKLKAATAYSDELQNLLANKESELEEFKTNNEKLNDRVTEMQANISFLESANEYLTNDLVESSGRCSSQSTEIGELKDKLKVLEDVETENQSMSKKIGELEEKADKLESANLTMNENLTESNKRYSLLIVDMEEAKTKFRLAVSEAKEYSEKVAAINKQQKSDLKTALAHNEKITTKSEQRKKKIEELDIANEKMTEWLKKLHGQVSELEETKSQLSLVSKALKFASETNNELSAKVAALASEVEAKTKEVKTQKEENIKLMERQKTILSDINMHTAALKTVQMRFNEPKES